MPKNKSYTEVVEGRPEGDMPTPGVSQHKESLEWFEKTLPDLEIRSLAVMLLPVSTCAPCARGASRKMVWNMNVEIPKAPWASHENLPRAADEYVNSRLRGGGRCWAVHVVYLFLPEIRPILQLVISGMESKDSARKWGAGKKQGKHAEIYGSEYED
jgi:hypothetical protein